MSVFIGRLTHKYQLSTQTFWYHQLTSYIWKVAVCICMSVCAVLSICLCVCLCLYVCPSVCLYVCPSVCLSVCVCVFVYMYVRLSVYMYVRVSVCMYVRLSVCVCVGSSFQEDRAVSLPGRRHHTWCHHGHCSCCWISQSTSHHDLSTLTNHLAINDRRTLWNCTNTRQ